MAVRDPKRAADEYLRTRVMTASREELRLMLLDGAIRFARQGLAGIEEGSIERAVDGISQCRDIVAELLSSIRDAPDPKLAASVRAIYAFLFRELAELGIDRDASRLRKVIQVLEYERETWVMLMDQLARERSVGVSPVGRGEASDQRVGTLSLEA